MPLNLPRASGWVYRSSRLIAIALSSLLASSCLPASPKRAETAAASQQASRANKSVRVRAPEAVIPVDADDPSWGSPLAPVTLIVFLDVHCPYCARTFPTLETLKQLYGPQRLRVVVKHSPLEPEGRSLAAAIAAQTVFDLGGADKFFEFERRLFEHSAQLSDENFVAWAGELGIGEELFVRAYADPRTRARVLQDVEAGRALGIQAVPAFLINGRPLLGARPLFSFQALIDEELAASNAALKAGFPKGKLYALRVLQNLLGPNAVIEMVASDTPKVWRVDVGDAPTLGPRDALVTVVQFVDLQCPFCAQAQSRLHQLVSEFSGQVRIVFKHNPLGFHPDALNAAQVAEEARGQRGQAGFWEAVDLLLRSKDLSNSNLVAIGQQLGLDTGALSRALADQTHRALVERDQDLAIDLGIEETPAYFVNGERIEIGASYSHLKRAVSRHLAKAKAAVKRQPELRPDYYARLMVKAYAPTPVEPAELAPPPTSSPARGSKVAPVQIQMFSNFDCSACAEAFKAVAAVERAFPGKVRTIWRHLPSRTQGSARLSARAALEARAQLGNVGFWKFSTLMYEDAERGEELSKEKLVAHARQLGMDLTRFRTALKDARHDAAIAADLEASRKVAKPGHPVFVVNGHVVRGKPAERTLARVIRFALHELKTNP